MGILREHIFMSRIKKNCTLCVVNDFCKNIRIIHLGIDNMPCSDKKLSSVQIQPLISV